MAAIRQRKPSSQLMKKPCKKSNQVRDPDTGRCRKMKRIKRKTRSRSRSSKEVPVAAIYGKRESGSYSGTSRTRAKYGRYQRTSSGRVVLGNKSVKMGTKNRSLSSCLASKKRLQKMVLRMAAKTMRPRSRSRSRGVASSLKSNRSRSRSASRRSSASSNSSSYRVSRRSKSRTPTEQEVKERVAARANVKYDDFLTNLAKKWNKKGEFSDADIEKTLKLAEKSIINPSITAVPNVPKKRIAPTRLV
jgi:hypothetical protein